jgi:arylsulfatase I/J
MLGRVCSQGGKMHNTEGGIRVNGFVSGGFLPEAVRGTETNALTTGWDFFATSCFLAGVDPADAKAAAAGLPPVDSINLWPFLTGVNTTRPRLEVQVGNAYTGDHAIGTNSPAQTVISAVVSDQRNAAGTTGTIWKYMVGHVAGNFWMGPKFPNISSTKDVPNSQVVDCGFGSEDQGGPGCLYDLLADPSEYTNLATTHPDIAASLLATLKAANETVFSPDRGVIADVACTTAQTTYGGFWGPFVGL